MLKEVKDVVYLGYWFLYCYNLLLWEKGKELMILDFKKLDFLLMKEFMC